MNPDSEKPFKDFSISCPDSAEKWQFPRKRAPFYQIVGGVSRRRWNRALENPPTEIDMGNESTVLATTPFFRQNLHLCQISQGLTP